MKKIRPLPKKWNPKVLLKDFGKDESRMIDTTNHLTLQIETKERWPSG
jgi:hypothetical protein